MVRLMGGSAGIYHPPKKNNPVRAIAACRRGSKSKIIIWQIEKKVKEYYSPVGATSLEWPPHHSPLSCYTLAEKPIEIKGELPGQPSPLPSPSPVDGEGEKSFSY